MSSNISSQSQPQPYVAETGEAYLELKPPECIACVHSLLSFLLLTHPFSSPHLELGFARLPPIPIFSASSFPPTSPSGSLVLHPVPYVKSLNHYFPSLLCASCFLLFPPSVSVTFPIDITKTRLQIQGQFAKGRLPYRGMLKTAFGIGRPGITSIQCC